MIPGAGNPSRRRRLTPRECQALADDLHIRFRIQLQRFQEGDLIPGEHEICESFRVPLSIARGLLARLKHDGVITSVKGKGSFLTKLGATNGEGIPGCRTIAIVAYLDTQHPDAPFNRTSGLLAYFDSECAAHQCRTQLFNTYPGFSVELDLLESLRAYKPDGILIIAHPGEAHDLNVRKLTTLGIPMVISGHPTKNANHVVFDEFWIAATGVDHLASLGHTQIEFLQVEGDDPWRLDRLAGFHETMQRRGLPVVPENSCLLPDLDGMDEVLAQFVRDRILAGGCTAVFCSGDIIAARLIELATHAGIAVPERLSVMGVDDDRRFRHLDLTTIPHAGATEGRTGFLLLSQVVRHRPRLPIVEKIRPQILVRRTTAQAPIAASAAP